MTTNNCSHWWQFVKIDCFLPFITNNCWFLIIRWLLKLAAVDFLIFIVITFTRHYLLLQMDIFISNMLRQCSARS